MKLRFTNLFRINILTFFGGPVYGFSVSLRTERIKLISLKGNLEKGHFVQQL